MHRNDFKMKPELGGFVFLLGLHVGKKKVSKRYQWVVELVARLDQTFA